jgi:hypothetical protein
MARKNSRLLAAAATIMLLASAASPALAASSTTLPTINFSTATGLNASTSDIQSTWQQLKDMGTTQYLGGMIGGFKLDESSMVAAALSIGVTEFDNFLKTGQLSSAMGGAGSLLSSVMSGGSGIDLSSIVGSFTAGGGAINATSILNTAGVTAAGGVCDPSVAADLATQGSSYVSDIVKVGQSDSYGFSKMSSLSSGGSTGGFASMGCLDKLFQNSGTDILFKPPTMGMLTSMLQNWTCPQVPGVAQQIASAFGDGSRFQTAGAGGFFPLLSFGEANDSTSPKMTGMGSTISNFFGSGFATTKSVSSGDVASMTSLSTLFK